jgi:hypothetical protein
MLGLGRIVTNSSLELRKARAYSVPKLVQPGRMERGMGIKIDGNFMPGRQKTVEHVEGMHLKTRVLLSMLSAVLMAFMADAAIACDQGHCPWCSLWLSADGNQYECCCPEDWYLTNDVTDIGFPFCQGYTNHGQEEMVQASCMIHNTE